MPVPTDSQPTLPRPLSADRRPLRIGIIAPPWVAVPPPAYGGTELVIDNLARGLVDRGHDVTLFTVGDSTCPVRRRWVHEKAAGTTADLLTELGHVQAAYEALSGCDVIHDHTLLGLLWSKMSSSTPPVVTTCHGPFTPALATLYETVGRHVAIVSISHHQRSTAPSVPVAAVIHHGIEVDRFPIGRGDGGYVLFLGRMSPDKGVHRAISIARAAGKRLIIAAKMWEPAEHRYFHERVEPLLGDDATYIGPVGGKHKLDLLAGAEALVNPIRWPEPFGLVMAEALACGTPVVTFPEGAASEIVDHEVTGFLCTDDVDMAERLATVDELDRSACRRAAALRFGIDRMVDEHVNLYRQHIAGEVLAGPGTIDLTGSGGSTSTLDQPRLFARR